MAVFLKDKNIRNALLVLVVFLQVAFFVFFAVNEKAKQETGKKIMLAVNPVDPRDYLSGNYFTVEYRDIGRINRCGGYYAELKDKLQNNTTSGKPNKREIFLLLHKPEGEDVFKIKTCGLDANFKNKTENDVILKGKLYGNRSDRIKYGIEKYFINENLEEPSRREKVTALIAIDEKKHTARILKIFVNGEEWGKK